MVLHKQRSGGEENQRPTLPCTHRVTGRRETTAVLKKVSTAPSVYYLQNPQLCAGGRHTGAALVKKWFPVESNKV
ncbi:hypothetical protein MHYP_G00042950 [Metynnis hypsauchen]